MPKAWSDEGKESIRAALIQEGRREFEKFGLLKATVDAIVAAAHVSKGTFYLFFETKEELFLEVLSLVRAEVHERLFKDPFPPGVSKRAWFRSFLVRVVESIASMPMFNLLDDAAMSHLGRKVPPERLLRHMAEYAVKSDRILEEWMERGLIRKVDLGPLNGIFLSFISHYAKNRSNETEKKAELALWADMLSAYFLKEE